MYSNKLTKQKKTTIEKPLELKVLFINMTVSTTKLSFQIIDLIYCQLVTVTINYNINQAQMIEKVAFNNLVIYMDRMI